MELLQSDNEIHDAHHKLPLYTLHILFIRKKNNLQVTFTQSKETKRNNFVCSLFSLVRFDAGDVLIGFFVGGSGQQMICLRF